MRVGPFCVCVLGVNVQMRGLCLLRKGVVLDLCGGPVDAKTGRVSTVGDFEKSQRSMERKETKIKDEEIKMPTGKLPTHPPYPQVSPACPICARTRVSQDNASAGYCPSRSSLHHRNRG